MEEPECSRKEKLDSFFKRKKSLCALFRQIVRGALMLRAENFGRRGVCRSFCLYGRASGRGGRESMVAGADA